MAALNSSLQDKSGSLDLKSENDDEDLRTVVMQSDA